MQNNEATTKEIAEYLGLSSSRTRAILSGMEDDLEMLGITVNRKYKLKKK